MEKEITYIDGKPKIELGSLENTVIQITSKKDYTSLMELYQSAGRKWGGTGDLPTSLDDWDDDKEKTCINAQIDLDGRFMRGTLDYYITSRKRVIQFSDYLDIQRIEKRVLEELSLWYQANNEK